MTSCGRQPDEETPLLQKKPKVPLPWSQLTLVFLALLAEPFSSTFIFPYVNQLIGELGITGGDDRKIGYYAGLIESLFFAAQALTTWRWSQLSDSIGRRPVILIGLLGLSLSNFAFGLSRSLPALIISRCTAGFLNGNVGVTKCVIGDITDNTNMAQAFAVVPIIYSLGAIIAPLYAGALVKPQEQWPNAFRGEFWSTYPYFLPSLVTGTITLLIFLACAIYLKESSPSKTCGKLLSEGLEGENLVSGSTKGDLRPIPMSILLKTYSVMIAIANYGTLALVEISFFTLLPLFYSSPTEIGGLGFPPSTIGTVLAIFGIVDGTVQALIAPRLVESFGQKRVFRWAIFWFYPLIITFPIMSAIVTVHGKVEPVILVLLVLQLIFMAFVDASYGVIFVIVTKAAPNEQSLGTTNGLGQSLASIARAVGPALTTSLFAISKEYDILGGNLVYVVLAILTTVLVWLSRRLPDLRDKE